MSSSLSNCSSVFVISGHESSCSVYQCTFPLCCLFQYYHCRYQSVISFLWWKLTFSSVSFTFSHLHFLCTWAVKPLFILQSSKRHVMSCEQGPRWGKYRQFVYFFFVFFATSSSFFSIFFSRLIFPHRGACLQASHVNSFYLYSFF